MWCVITSGTPELTETFGPLAIKEVFGPFPSAVIAEQWAHENNKIGAIAVLTFVNP